MAAVATRVLFFVANFVAKLTQEYTLCACHVPKQAIDDVGGLAFAIAPPLEVGLNGRLNTAFVERVNLTIRRGVAALTRRTWSTAQATL